MSTYNFAGGEVLCDCQMRRLLPTLALVAVMALLGTAQAAAETALAPAFVPDRLVVKFEGAGPSRAVALPAGAALGRSAEALRRNPRVAYAEPNWVATASAVKSAETPAEIVVPDDSGSLGEGAEAAALGDWTFKQWNFLGWEGTATAKVPLSSGGIDAVGAWANLAAVGRPGADGVTVAVLDTGIAYRNKGRNFLRSPDFSSGQFVKGWDFVDGDGLPLDENGHGTHVAGTIAERTDNGLGLTGLAYRAKLMPVRVLDKYGRGNAAQIAKGIRYAVANRAQVINLSFNFGCDKKVPGVDEALREAFAAGVVVVASAGNVGSETCVSEPATGPRVIAVGGSTEGGCLGNYSLAGTAIDLLGPGGGIPQAGCPSIASRPIYQVTLKPGTTDVFGIPGNYVGTSMAAAHVSGVAAMVRAARAGTLRALAPKARVEAITRRLRQTARSLELPRTQQGAGLVDAAAATDPTAGAQPVVKLGTFRAVR
jgi:serine protease